MKSTLSIRLHGFVLFVCLLVFFYHHGKSLFICLEITSPYELEALPWWKVAQRLNCKGGGDIGDT